MTHADINDLETRDYIFKIGDREKAIQARYDENTDALIFPRAAFDYVYKLLEEALSQEPCDDAISREAAIDAIESWLSCCNYNKAERHIMRAMQSILYDLPSVTQKSGEWDRSCTCSVCGQWRILESEKNGGKYKYCPNCGCRMVEPQESEDKE